MGHTRKKYYDGGVTATHLGLSKYELNIKRYFCF